MSQVSSAAQPLGYCENNSLGMRLRSRLKGSALSADPNMPLFSCKQCPADARRTLCARCRACLTHQTCRCVECWKCNSLVPPKDICSKCRVCKRHHLGEVIPEGRPFPKRECELEARSASTFVMNKLHRRLGFEIELANFGGLNGQRSPLGPMAFQFVHDGSVKPSGQELVSAPMLGDAYMLGMGKLIERLGGASANETCGFHVHVDAAAISMQQMRRVYLGWMAIQDQVYGKLVSRSRLKSPGVDYAHPLRPAPERRLALESAEGSDSIQAWFYSYLYNLQTKSAEGLRGAQLAAHTRRIREQITALGKEKYRNEARRQALNFHSWVMRGTIEFRLKEGTTQPGDLLFWPLFCGWVVEKFSDMTNIEVKQWLHAALAGKGPSLREVLESWSRGAKPIPSDLFRWAVDHEAI